MGLIISSVICSYYPQNIILVSPLAVGKNMQKKRTNQEITSYTFDLIKLVTTYKLQFINLFQAMIDQGNLTTLCKGQLDDGSHFGAEEYQLLANLIVAKLAIDRR